MNGCLFLDGKITASNSRVFDATTIRSGLYAESAVQAAIPAVVLLLLAYGATRVAHNGIGIRWAILAVGTGAFCSRVAARSDLCGVCFRPRLHMNHRQTQLGVETDGLTCGGPAI